MSKMLEMPDREADFYIPPNDHCGYLGFDVWVEERIYCVYNRDNRDKNDCYLYDNICGRFAHIKNPVDHLLAMCEYEIDGKEPNWNTDENIQYHKEIKHIVENYVVDKVILEV